MDAKVHERHIKRVGTAGMLVGLAAMLEGLLSSGPGDHLNTLALIVGGLGLAAASYIIEIRRLQALHSATQAVPSRATPR